MIQWHFYGEFKYGGLDTVGDGDLVLVDKWKKCKVLDSKSDPPSFESLVTFIGPFSCSSLR